MITLYCSPAVFPSDKTRKNHIPQVRVGGSCSTKWSQATTQTGTSAHSCPLKKATALLDITFDPVRSSVLLNKNVCSLSREIVYDPPDVTVTKELLSLTKSEGISIVGVGAMVRLVLSSHPTSKTSLMSPSEFVSKFLVRPKYVDTA